MSRFRSSTAAVSVLPVLVLALLTGACQGNSKGQLLKADESAVQLRSMQTRAFDTTDRVTMLRTVMATLQDLSFLIDSADATLGSVTATKLERGSVRLTVTVRPRGEKQTLVRANATIGIRPVDDPLAYQEFFASLSKALFLEAHQVE